VKTVDSHPDHDSQDRPQKVSAQRLHLIPEKLPRLRTLCQVGEHIAERMFLGLRLQESASRLETPDRQGDQPPGSPKRKLDDSEHGAPQPTH
jgi:hypothetical protein